MAVILLFLLPAFGHFDQFTAQSLGPFHGMVTLEMTDEGLQFATDVIEKQLEVEIRRMEIPNQKHHGPGFHVELSEIKIDRVDLLQIIVDPKPLSALHVIVNAGDFQLCAKWRSVIAIIPGPAGRVCAWSNPQRGFEFSAIIHTAITKGGTLQLTTSNCKMNVPLVLDLHVTGPIGFLFNPIRGLISSIAQSQIRPWLCHEIAKNVRMIFERTQLQLSENYALKYSLHKFDVLASGVTVQTAANVTRL